MHEFSIVQALMAQVDREAAARHATAVTRIEVVLGEESGVDPHLLRSAYSAYRTGTIAGGAPLHIIVVPVTWRCSRCDASIARGAPLTCPACGAPARIVQGDEILLERLEMEVP